MPAGRELLRKVFANATNRDAFPTRGEKHRKIFGLAATILFDMDEMSPLLNPDKSVRLPGRQEIDWGASLALHDRWLRKIQRRQEPLIGPFRLSAPDPFSYLLEKFEELRRSDQLDETAAELLREVYV